MNWWVMAQILGAVAIAVGVTIGFGVAAGLVVAGVLTVVGATFGEALNADDEGGT